MVPISMPSIIARIIRAIDSIADRKIGAVQAFAAAHINDVVVGRCDCDSADGLRVFTIEDGEPGAAVVGRLPDPAVDLPDVKDVRLIGYTGTGARAAAAERPDHAPVHVGH